MSKSNTKVKVAIAIVAIAIISYLIPYDAWDHEPWTNRYIIEGEVTAIDNGEITVAIKTANDSDPEAFGEDNVYYGTSPKMYGAYVVLTGKVPEYCNVGQSVLIGIYAGDSIYDKVGKSVDVSFYRENNLLFGLIIPKIAPFEVAPSTMTLDTLNTVGTSIIYYKTKDHR